MDAVDGRLLAALRANGRATFAELARLVGLSGPAVHERVSKLEAAGVITGYHAAVAPAALGSVMTALIGIFITDSADLDRLAGDLEDIPEVEDCWFVAGEETYVIKVSVRDVAGLEHVITALNAVHGVARTRTTVVLSTKFEDRLRPSLPAVSGTVPGAAPSGAVPSGAVPSGAVPSGDASSGDAASADQDGRSIAGAMPRPR